MRTFIESLLFVAFLFAGIFAFAMYRKAVNLEMKVIELSSSLTEDELKIRKLEQDILIINNIVYKGDFVEK